MHFKFGHKKIIYFSKSVAKKVLNFRYHSLKKMYLLLVLHRIKVMYSKLLASKKYIHIKEN